MELLHLMKNVRKTIHKHRYICYAAASYICLTKYNRSYHDCAAIAASFDTAIRKELSENDYRIFVNWIDTVGKSFNLRYKYHKNNAWSCAIDDKIVMLDKFIKALETENAG